MKLQSVSKETNIRGLWNEDEECWYLIVIDVIGFLLDTKEPYETWKSLKKKTLEKKNIDLSGYCKLIDSVGIDKNHNELEIARKEGLIKMLDLLEIEPKEKDKFKEWVLNLKGLDALDKEEKTSEEGFVSEKQFDDRLKVLLGSPHVTKGKK
jgi:hypothetical protein